MKTLTVVLGLMTIMLALAACGGDAPGNGPAKAPPILRKAVPPEYKDAKPPEGFDMASAENIKAGEDLFQNPLPKGNCASCHGTGGKGDGPQGAALDPKPTDLTSAEFQTGAKDDYIHWRIKTGGIGGPAGSAMTGFVSAENDTQIWQLVAYVRSLKGK